MYCGQEPVQRKMTTDKGKMPESNAKAGLKPGERPTLKTLSRLSGLAVPTVSRALSDAPDISEKTKKRIREIAQQVGYVPNHAGVRLRTGRTNVISLILSNRNELMNHTAVLVTSISLQLRDTPFLLIITPYFEDQDPLDPVRHIVETGSADAVILNQIKPDDARVRYLINKGFPFVTHGRTEAGLNHPYFDYDNEAFGREAIDTLAQRGCRSVVMIAPPRGQSYAEHMIAGATETAQRRGIRLLVEPNTNISEPGDKIRDCVRQRLIDNPEVDGYVCASTIATMLAVAETERAGRTIGQDIQFVAKEPSRFIHLFRSGIIAIPEDIDRAGRFLAKAAIQAIREPDKPPMQELDVPKTIVE